MKNILTKNIAPKFGKELIARNRSNKVEIERIFNEKRENFNKFFQFKYKQKNNLIHTYH